MIGYVMRRNWEGYSDRLNLYIKSQELTALSGVMKISLKITLIRHSTETPVLSHQVFFFVNKRFEISNLDLIGDMISIVRIEEVSPDNNY